MSEDQEIEPKSRIHWPDLQKTKLTVEISLTLEQWRSFAQATEKSGGEIARKICQSVFPAIHEVEDVQKAIKERKCK